jgi:thiol-disulfide isomerase/thioredoxin
MAHVLKLTAVAALSLASVAVAQESKEEKQSKTMTIGDAAPAINIEHWVKGDKVAAFDDGKVYVVEFWATWCGPCKTSMPHITSLQQQYKDYGVTFIGISDEKLDTVTKFMDTVDKKSGKKWSDVVGYTLTTDPDESVKSDYFTAAGQNGIPCAFIVGKDQHVEWIGHPMQIDKPLEAVVKDSWDRAKFKGEWENEQAAGREMMKNRQALATAMKEKNWDKAIEILDGTLSKNPKDLAAGMTKFRVLATDANQPEKAYAFAREFGKANADNAMALNAIAWTIVDDAAIKERDLDLALEFARRANAVSDEKDPAILDTLARCYYEKGDLANAVKTQEQAAKNAGSDEMGEEIKANLKKYQDELAKKGS